MKKTTLALVLMFSTSAFADVASDFESLGGNQIILEKAKALNPEKEVTIVQERTVPRRNRWEFAPEYSGSFGGDSYVKTMSAGLNIHYHINPRWSLGLKHNKHFNKLTDEGDRMVDDAIKEYHQNPTNTSRLVPNIDYAREEQLALVNWYPIYGKMNLLDKGIAQFDVYVLAGYGQAKMSTETTPTYTAGGGLGIWWTRNFSTRVEMRYQNYRAQYIDGERDLNLAIASAQMGWML